MNGQIQLWRQGRRISLALIELSRCGARVILPKQFEHEGSLCLLIKSELGTQFIETRVAWRERLATGSLVVGLQFLLQRADL